MDWADLTREQRRIAQTFDRSLSITAGAGTGKTTTLTTRYMQLFDQQLDAIEASDAGRSTRPTDLPLRPTQIVTSTFTKRAAGELEDSIRDRIGDRLDAASTDLAHNYWQTVARDLDDAYIHTLHSFCSRILREFALESERVEPGFDVIEGAEQAERIAQAVNEALAAEMTDDQVEILSEIYGRSQLAAVLRGFLLERPESRQWASGRAGDHPDDYIDTVWEMFFPISQITAEHALSEGRVRTALENLSDLYHDPPAGLGEDTAWDHLADLAAAIETHEMFSGLSGRDAQRALNRVCDVLTKSDGDSYARSYHYHGSKGTWGDYEEARQTLADNMDILREELDPSETFVDHEMVNDEAAAPYVIALAELTETALDRYQQLKQTENLVDNTDLVSGALEVLRTEEVRSTLVDDFEHILIDEFQDTDPRQWDIVQGLTNTLTTMFDADNVFVVGDKKQSIYRFRNADVTAFDQTSATIRGAAPETRVTPPDGEPFDPPEELSMNFRTLPSTLQFLNALFDSVFDAAAEAAYEAAPQSLRCGRLDPDDLGHLPEYIAVPTDEDLRMRMCPEEHPLRTERFATDADTEGYAVAARIATMLDDEMQVYEDDIAPDDESATGRPVEPDDISILIRSRSDLKAYERALSDAGIPYNVASGIGFHEKAEVATLENLLKILADPSDDILLYGVLRSPLFGIADPELARAYAETPSESLWGAMDETSVDAVVRARSQLEEWRDRVGTTPGGDAIVDSWASFISEVIDATGYMTAMAADNGHQAVANIDKFRSLLRQFEAGGSLSLGQLLQRLRAHQEHEDKEGEAVLSEDATGVQILTIHDAKGEEFPVVIVPGVGRQYHDEARIGGGAVEFESIDGVPWAGINGPDPENPIETANTQVRTELRSQRRDEERAEEKRVLYVAATRARDKLVFVGRHSGTVDDSDEGEVTPIFEAPDADAEPKSWQDLLQPLLFPDDAAADLAATPDQRLQFDGVGYRLRLPDQRVPDLTTEATSTPTYEMSPAPSSPAPDEFEYRLTASTVPAVLDPENSIAVSVDDEEGLIYLDRDAEVSRLSDTTEVDAMPRNMMGDIVHAIAERRPPEDEWPAVMHALAARHDFDYELTADDVDTITDHARAACNFVDELTPSDAIASMDEVGVTVDLPRGSVRGDIDHLLMTDEEYVIVDYKTGALPDTSSVVDEKAAHYQPQLDAYVTGLADESNRPIRTILYFTEPQVARQQQYAVDEIPTLRQQLDSRIWSAIH